MFVLKLLLTNYYYLRLGSLVQSDNIEDSEQWCEWKCQKLDIITVTHNQQQQEWRQSVKGALSSNIRDENNECRLAPYKPVQHQFAVYPSIWLQCGQW